MNITLNTVFDEQNQDRPYRNDIAADLNVVLGSARSHKELLEESQDIYGHLEGAIDRHESAVINTVQRVAEFENIKVKK